MKKLLIIGLALAGVLFVSSCSSTSMAESNPEAASQVATTEVAEVQGDTTTLTLLLSTGEAEIDLADDTVTLTLFGYDPALADMPATQIMQSTYVIDTLPALIALHVPNNAAEMIDPAVHENSEPGYYVTISGNSTYGKVMVDFNKAFPYVKLATGLQTIQLKELK